MRYLTIIAFALIICVSVWGMVIWNLVQDNETADNITIEVTKEVEDEQVSSLSEQYHKQGITREDAKLIAPSGEISVDELLDIVQWR